MKKNHLLAKVIFRNAITSMRLEGGKSEKPMLGAFYGKVQKFI